MNESEDIDLEKKEKFLNSLSDKDYKRISDMLTHFLYSAEEEGKAQLMGKNYRSRLLDEIDDNMMLRLCSVVDKAFLPDLDYLEDYSRVNENSDYICCNLNALGLLRDMGNVYEEENDGWKGSSLGSAKHQLNEIGSELLRIKGFRKIYTTSKLFYCIKWRLRQACIPRFPQSGSYSQKERD